MRPNTMVPQIGQAPVAGQDATCVMAGSSDGGRWILYSVSWSYSGPPTGGQLIISWGSNVMTFAVGAGGVGQLMWPSPLRFPVNVAVTITLKAGGASIAGTVYPQAWNEH